jgi:hypothetical protein
VWFWFNWKGSNVENPKAWNINFTLSGGFLGLQRVMELSNIGQMVLIDQKKKKQVTVQLSEEDIVKIDGLITETVKLQPVGSLPVCADCYEYKFNIQINTQQFFFQANDLNLARSGLAPLVNVFTELQGRANLRRN